MADTTTFSAQISCFFRAFWAFVLKMLSSKPRSTTHSDDLEVGIPSDPVNQRVPDRFNTASPVVSGSRSIDGFVNISLNQDSKIKTIKAISIASHIFTAKANVVDMDHSRHFQPTVKNDRIFPISFPVIPMNGQIHAVDNHSNRVVQSGPPVPKLPEDDPKSKSRTHLDSISHLLDQFPAPPTHIPLLPPVINRDVILQTVEKTPLGPVESCPSPTISEDSTDSPSSGSSSILSTNPSTSISNETANTSVHENLEFIPRSSAVFKVLASGIDVKEKNMARLTLVHNPETFILPATDIRGRARSQSLFTSKPKALPRTYHDVVDSPRQADLRKGDISKDALSKERRERVDAPAFISEDYISRGTKHEADLRSLRAEYSLAPIHNLENASHRLLDKHTSVRAPVQAIPAVPTKWIRPAVAPLRIVKKNKVRHIVVPLEPPVPVARRDGSGNWELAMDNVLKAFRDAEMEDRDFRDLFYGDSSFVSQSSVINSLGDDRHLGGRDEYDDRRLEDSFDSIEKSVDEILSMLSAPPDLVALKVEDLASVSLSSERAVDQRIMEVKDMINKVDLPVLRLCGCEGYEDSYSWTAATDDDNNSQEDDQWSDRLELADYVS